MARLTDEVLRDIADKASASPISVMRRLLGLDVKGLSGTRIDAVLADRAFDKYLEECRKAVE